jgi:cell division protein FtsW (lipid II flippase)
MKRSVQDYKQTWVTTATSIIALVFVVLVSFNLITPEQSGEVQKYLTDFLFAVSAGITAVASIIAIFKGDR